MVLARAIREERERRKLSQSALARRAGITSQAINQIEHGKYRPSEEVLRGIVAVFGMGLGEFYLLAYTTDPDRAATINDLAARGIPPAVQAELERAAEELTEEQWAIIVAIVREMTTRQEQSERRPRTVRPAEA